jgi:hypothetical protein
MQTYRRCRHAIIAINHGQLAAQQLRDNSRKVEAQNILWSDEFRSAYRQKITDLARPARAGFLVARTPENTGRYIY